VAILILKSAVELAVELIRSRGEETPDLSKFQFGIYERFRRSQLCSYMLFLVRNHEADTKPRLIDKKLLVEAPVDVPPLELTPAGEKRLAANRFFLAGDQPLGLKKGTGSILRIVFSLVVRWSVFLAAGFLLVTQAAVRISLIYQRHLSIRERAAKKHTKLQTDGFYRRVRHPTASNRLLYSLGLCFAPPTVWAAVPFTLFAVMTIFSGIIEEHKEIGKLFGTEYQAYKRDVPRRYLTPWLAVYLGIAAAAFVTGLVW